MSTSDRILVESFRHAIEAISRVRDTADRAVHLVRADSAGASVCSAHSSMVEMQIANLKYMEVLGEGIETLLTGAIATLNSHMEKTNWNAMIIYANLALLTLNLLLQFFDVTKFFK